jgi:hypothetical protein
LNGWRGAASNLRLTYREFFGGGDGKPPENFSSSTGRRRRSSRQFSVCQSRALPFEGII